MVLYDHGLMVVSIRVSIQHYIHIFISLYHYIIRGWRGRRGGEEERRRGSRCSRGSRGSRGVEVVED